MRFAQKVSSRVVFMDRGSIAEIGPAKRLFARPSTARLKQFLRNAHV
jgi:ABC-type histidine transport system ATPase subunit